MSDPGGVADERFVSVAEAAAALGISDRQVRRWVGRLADADRKSDGRGGHHVRLSALVALRGEAAAGRTLGRTPVRKSDADMSGSRTEVGHPDADIMSARLADAEKRAAVAEARAELLAAERDRLVETLASAQENARLEAENHRAALMLAGRKAAPMLEGQPLADSGQEGQSAASEGRDGSTGRTESPGASWWARLWRRA